MTTTNGTIKPDKPAQPLFKSPYAIPVVGGNSLIYSPSPAAVDVAKPSAPPPGGFTYMATDPGFPQHEALVAQGWHQRMYVEWGFDNSPQKLTTAGGDLLANVLLWHAAAAVSPASGVPGTIVTFKATGFAGVEKVTVIMGGLTVISMPTGLLGGVNQQFKVPALPPGNYVVSATGSRSGRKATTIFTVS